MEDFSREYFTKKANKMSKKYNISNIPTFDIYTGTSGRVLGTYNGSTNHINLNLKMFKNKKDIKETIIHELCHWIIRFTDSQAKAHGREWKNVMINEGISDPKAKNKTIRSQGPKSLFCSCREYKVSTRRYNNVVMRGVLYRCRTCKSDISTKRVHSIL